MNITIILLLVIIYTFKERIFDYLNNRKNK